MIKRIFKNEKIVFWSLAFGVLFMAGLYTYLMNNTVMNVVKRSSAEENISVLRTDTAELESRYLSLSKRITVELAYSLGYMEAKPTFIAKRAVSVLPTPENLQ